MSKSSNSDGSMLLSFREPVYTTLASKGFPCLFACWMALIKGAIFMKLGRAPAIIVIFISFFKFYLGKNTFS